MRREMEKRGGGEERRGEEKGRREGEKGKSGCVWYACACVCTCMHNVCVHVCLLDVT